MRLTTSTGNARKIFRAGLIAVVAVSVFAAALQPAEAARKKTRHARAATRHSAHYVHHAVKAADRYASIIIDAADGTVLSEKDADRKLYPASLTKMMTLYITFSALENGTLRRSDRIPVSAHAADQEPSKLGLEAGTSIRVEDAILGIVTKSANDAATALGESLGGGSEERFAGLMNARARALGMNNTRFVNPSGLFDPQQVSSARDMAILGRALVRDFPREYRYFSTPAFTWAGKVMENHNRLMASYDGMDGIKTGYVHQSGFNLVASAVRENHRLIGVIFGGRTTASRNAQMAALLDKGFATVRQPRLASGAPRFDAMGLALKGDAQEDEGDADINAAPVPDGVKFAEQLRPQPISTRTLGAYSPRAGGETAPANVTAQLNAAAANTARAAPAEDGDGANSWAVQIGSFNSRAAGQQALRHAQTRLAPRGSAAGAAAVVVPLATNRGTIYRARLSGLDRAGAEDVCRVLKGNCLILAMQ